MITASFVFVGRRFLWFLVKCPNAIEVSLLLPRDNDYFNQIKARFRKKKNEWITFFFCSLFLLFINLENRIYNFKRRNEDAKIALKGKSSFSMYCTPFTKLQKGCFCKNIHKMFWCCALQRSFLLFSHLNSRLFWTTELFTTNERKSRQSGEVLIFV